LVKQFVGAVATSGKRGGSYGAIRGHDGSFNGKD